MEQPLPSLRTDEPAVLREMNDFGGMVSFNLKGNKLADAIKIVSNTHYFTLAESLGGVESLIGQETEAESTSPVTELGAV